MVRITMIPKGHKARDPSSKAGMRQVADTFSQGRLCVSQENSGSNAGKLRIEE